MNAGNKNAHIGILLMAHGGPNQIADLPGYLANIRSGRTTSSRIIQELTLQYEQLGGSSPLLARSVSQVEALQNRLNPAEFKCYLGMRYWSPYIEETINHMREEGIQKAIAIVLAPQYSKVSIGKYHAQIQDGLDFYRVKIDFHFVHEFYQERLFIRAMSDRVNQGFSMWGQKEDVFVLFTAHSIPERFEKMGDAYSMQVKETARLIAEDLKIPEGKWGFSYQSAGRSPEAWLGPSLEESLESCAQKNIRKIMVFPVGFVSDHSETLFDLDINAKQTALKMGITLKRPPALNDSPLFIDALEKIVRESLAS
jgi:ferrochelatase